MCVGVFDFRLGSCVLVCGVAMVRSDDDVAYRVHAFACAWPKHK